MNDELMAQLIEELTRTAPDLRRLAENEDALGRVVKAYEAGDVETVRTTLEELQLLKYCTVICRWLCFWHCLKICRVFCREFPAEPFEIPELRRYSQGLAKLASDAEASKRLMEAVSGRDVDTFNEILNQFELQPFCFLVCRWICHLHCRRFCWIVCHPGEPLDEVEPLEEFRQTAEAVVKLTDNEETFKAALEAVQAGDYAVLRDIFRELEIIPCILICRWLCWLYCYRICWIYCVRIPHGFEVGEFGKLLSGWQELVASGDGLKELVDAFAQDDRDRFLEILDRFNLRPYCFIICRWICFYYCYLFCRLVCPPPVYCHLDAPKDCVKERYDIAQGELFVEVRGTASGAAFDRYTIEVNRDGDPPIPDIVSYPGGGTSGDAPVVNGELGRINTMTLTDSAYTVTLTVYPEGGGAPAVCIITFNLLKVMVLMDKVGAIQAVSMAPIADNPNPLDPDAELRKDYAAAPPPNDYQLVSVGGDMTVDGMAYIYGCSGRQITKYEIRYARVIVPLTEPPQPPMLAPIPATWPVGNQIVEVVYTPPDDYLPWTRLGPSPTNLIRKWAEVTIFGVTYRYLKEEKWHSGSVGSGRYSLLLTAEDSIGATFHDIQHIWLDNRPVYAKLTGIENVAACAELSLSQFANTTMNIEGIAWDRLIDDAFPDTAPNDNFDYYTLTLHKQGGSDHVIGTFSNRVIDPFRKDGVYPTDATAEVEAGTLASFDIATVLDAANVGSDPSVSIPRNEGCAYYLRLDVYDKTRLDDDSDRHYAHDIWPFCIVNDLS